MERIGDNLPQIASQPPASDDSKNKARRSQSLCRSDINELWEFMAHTFGSKFVSQYGETDTNDVWLGGLAGISREQILRGERMVIQSGASYPPSLPDFRRMCLGIPMRSNAKMHLFDGSEFSRTMWKFIDGWRYDRANTYEADKMVDAAYDSAVAFLESGGKPPDKPVALIQKQERRIVPASDMTVQSEIAKMRKALGGYE